MEIPRGVMGAVKMKGANNVEFHAVHRIGQQRDDGKPRPIIVRFVKRERINDLWYRRKELANSPNHQPVILVLEYRHETAYEQKKLANALRNARKMNLAPAYINNGRSSFKEILIQQTKFRNVFGMMKLLGSNQFQWCPTPRATEGRLLTFSVPMVGH